MGKLNLLHHKSYHPYKAENVAKVLADEAKAALIDQESDRKSMLADSEARLDRMRKKSRKKDREGQGEGEKELAKQLSGKSSSSSTNSNERIENGTQIIRPDKKGKGKETIGPSEKQQDSNSSNGGGHINFWSEFEAGGKTTAVNLEAALEKAVEEAKMTDQTKIYLAKKGEGDPKGWYASFDGKSEQERKEGIEGNLERAYKDGEHKRLSDPLAMMNSYLQRRSDIKTGVPIKPAYPPSKSKNGYERYPSATPSSQGEGGNLSPIITSLLAPRRRKGEAPQSHSNSTRQHPLHSTHSNSSTSNSNSNSIETESLNRTTSERSRAQALIAASRRAARSSSTSTTSGGSTIGFNSPTESMRNGADSGFGFFTKAETREAGERRRGTGNGGGGWMERKEERRGRESGGGGGGNRWNGR